MSSKLSTANPYLRDPIVRRRSVFTSVSSSSAIEGIHAPFKKAKVTTPIGQFIGYPGENRASRSSYPPENLACDRRVRAITARNIPVMGA